MNARRRSAVVADLGMPEGAVYSIKRNRDLQRVPARWRGLESDIR